MADVHVFTSITSNYLPKARVLAESVKRHAPQAVFHLVLSDNPPPGFDLSQEPFDNLITTDSLPLDNPAGWCFSHTVVELCTAVKGLALEAIFERHDADRVFFFDPDMVVFGRFEELVAALDESSLLLTPHQTDPEQTDDAIRDNEMASLQFGVFNLGFVGVRNDTEGRRFARWWRDRLLHYCHDDLPKGLFTDQKWVNLAPCFFDNIRVLRSPAFNVATWNITQREATGSMATGVSINGEPLGFYHFSGFDSGAQEVMLNKYGSNSPVLYELREWYIDTCRQKGQEEMGQLPSRYASYEDGTPIRREERVLYRQREDLRAAFPDPFSTAGNGGYRAWYRANVGSVPGETFRVVNIPTDAPVREVCADLADWLRLRAVHAKGRMRRLLCRLMARFLGLLGRSRRA